MKIHERGKKGEELAAQYLKTRGYEIKKTQYRRPGGEIDIVAEKNSVLIFVEVKTRTSETFGRGEESVNRLKKYHLRKTIEYYMEVVAENPDADFRLDIVEIILSPESGALKTISHFEDIEL